MFDYSKIIWSAVLSVLFGVLSLITAVASDNATVSVCLGLNSITFALISLREN